jgi:hypothetical protein
MLEVIPPLTAQAVGDGPIRPPVVVRIRPAIRYPAFLLRNQRAAELIRQRWGEVAMHALFAEHAPGANPDTHGFTVAEHGALSWVDWVEHQRHPPRLTSWFQVNDTWQSLAPQAGLEHLVKAAGPVCLDDVPQTLWALADATGLFPLLPGAFGQFVRQAGLSPSQMELLATLVGSPRIVGNTIEFAGAYRGRVGRVVLDVAKAKARLESRFEYSTPT